MPLQVRIEEGPRSKSVRFGGLQYRQYSQEKIGLITLLSDHVLFLYTNIHTIGIFFEKVYGKFLHFEPWLVFLQMMESYTLKREYMLSAK